MPDIDKSKPSAYGYCPTCGQPGQKRERRPNGNTTCGNGHVHKSREFDATPRPVASMPPTPPVDLAAIPDADLQVEIKRRAEIEKQRLEAIRQAKIAVRSEENDRVSEHVDVLLGIFQEHHSGYRKECSDDDPQDIDWGNSNIGERCGRCVLLRMKDEPWGWSHDNRFVFRVVNETIL